MSAPVVRDPLAPAERDRLAQLEQTVESGLQVFVQVGKALVEIRDTRLYRESHATFEAYLDERWGMSRSRAYRLIDGAAVAELVSPMGDIPNERQARELAHAVRGEGEQAAIDVWRELRAKHGERVTAELIRRHVGRRLEGEEKARDTREAAVLEHDEHVRRWQEFAAAFDPGDVVWESPPVDEDLRRDVETSRERVREAEAQRAGAEKRLRTAREELRKATAQLPQPPAGLGLCLISPGSQFVDVTGHAYVSPDGERIVLVGQKTPHRPGWAAWGFEAAGDVPTPREVDA